MERIFYTVKTMNLPLFIERVIKKELKRDILSVSFQNDLDLSKYTILTNKGYLAIRYSDTKELIDKIEKVVMLCRNEGVTVAEIVYSDPYLLIEKIEGEPFVQKGLHIFEYNKVLTSFAQQLIKLHAIDYDKLKFLESSSTSPAKPSPQDQLKILRKKNILTLPDADKIITLLQKKQPKSYRMLLHGNIASSILYVNKNLEVTSIINFSKPIIGDPNYEMAGFLINEGFDRTRRLIKSYYLAGGFVEWDSPFFITTSVKRVIDTLLWRMEKKQTQTEKLERILHKLISSSVG